MTNLKEDFKPYGYMVAKGSIEGELAISKFGENPEVTTSTDPEDIWDYGGTYTYTANTGADYYFSSSNAADTQSVKFYVLTVDSLGNWNMESFSQAVVGQTKTKLLPPSGDKPVRIWRMYNVGATNIQGVLYVYEDDTVLLGVPQTPSKVRAIINGATNTTLMSHFTVPTGYVAFLYGGFSGLKFSGAPTATSATINISARNYGGVFRIGKRASLITSGTTISPEMFAFPLSFPARTDIKFVIEEVSATLGAGTRYDIQLTPEEKLNNTFLDSIGQVRRVT